MGIDSIPNRCLIRTKWMQESFISREISIIISPDKIINNYCRTYGGKGCRRSVDLSPGGDMDRMDRTWGRADHYVKLTWDWVKYQGGLSKVRLGDIGHSITITKRLM